MSNFTKRQMTFSSTRSTKRCNGQRKRSKQQEPCGESASVTPTKKIKRNEAPPSNSKFPLVQQSLLLAAALRMNNAGIALLEAGAREDEWNEAQEVLEYAARAAATASSSSAQGRSESSALLQECMGVLSAARARLSMLPDTSQGMLPLIDEISGAFVLSNSLQILPHLRQESNDIQSAAISSTVAYNLGLSHHLEGISSGCVRSIETARGLYKFSEALLTKMGPEDKEGKQGRMLHELGLSALHKSIANNAAVISFEWDGDWEGARVILTGLGVSNVTCSPNQSSQESKKIGSSFVDVFVLNALVAKGMMCPSAA